MRQRHTTVRLSSSDTLPARCTVSRAVCRFNPTETGDKKRVVDSKAPSADYLQCIESEVRYARLMQAFPQRAEKLFNEAAQNAKAKYEKLLKLQKLYNTEE